MRSCEVPGALAHVISMRVDPEKGEEVVTRTAGEGEGRLPGIKICSREMQQIKIHFIRKRNPSGPQK